MSLDRVGYDIELLADIKFEFEYELEDVGKYFDYKLARFTLSSFKSRNDTVLDVLAALHELIVSESESESFTKFIAHYVCFIMNVATLKITIQEFSVIKQSTAAIVQQLMSDAILMERYLESIISIVNFILKSK